MSNDKNNNDDVKYEVSRIRLDTVNCDIMVMAIPVDEIDDKLTYLTREKGLIRKSLYDDFLIATCISNLNDFLNHLNQKGTNLVKLNEIRQELIEKILEINTKLMPANLVINKNNVVKMKKRGQKDARKLDNNEFWAKDAYKDTEAQMLKGDGKKTKLDLSRIKSVKDLKYIPVQKFWKRIGQYVSVKQFPEDSTDIILGGRAFTTRTSFEQYVVTICIEEVEDLFVKLDALGLPNRVAPPTLVHELYNLCKSSNPFLDFNVYKESRGEDVEDDTLDPFGGVHQTAEQGDELEHRPKKKTKLFKHVGKETLIGLGSYIKEQVIGQDKAIDEVVDAIQRSSVGLKDPERPLGAFVFAGYSGCGKCHGKGTPIRMYDGSVKMVEDITDGDLLMGDDSTPREVLSIARGKDQMFRIIPRKGGNSFVCNESHIISLRNSKTKDIINISIEDYLKQGVYFKSLHKLYRVGVDYKHKHLSIDPYFVGLWLGDGHMNRPAVTTSDSEIVEYLYGYASKLGLEVNINYHEDNLSNTYILSSGSKGGKSDRNILLNEMRSYGLMTGEIDHKFIPTAYLINNMDNRKKLLAGLIDSDGYMHGKCYEIITKYTQLAKNIVELARSIGCCAYITDKPVDGKIYYRVNISGDLSDLPIKLSRKISENRQQIKDVKVTSFVIEKLSMDDYYGFTLDGNGLYLLEDFTVTHNTYTAKILAEKLIGTRESLITIDCSEYSSDHEYAKLIGAPSGYIGHEHGGYLTNAVKKNPFSIVLFDEIEKASDKVHQLLLQVMDEARLTDGKGHKVSFRDCIVVMTSNIGVKEVSDIGKSIGFGDVSVVTDDKRTQAIENALKKKFKPEFLNRISAIINFNELTKENYFHIIKLELDKLRANLAASGTEFSGVKLVFDESVMDHIYEEGIDDNYGARPLVRTIEKEISTPLARRMLNEDIKGRSEVKISLKDSHIYLEVEKEVVEDPPFYMEAGSGESEEGE